jgi:hypothetical protein
MKRQDYLNKIEEEMTSDEFTEILEEAFNDIEKEVNDIKDLLDNLNLDSIENVRTAYEKLNDLSKDLY